MCPCYVVIECVFFHAKRHRILRNFSCTAQLWNDRSCDQCQPITVQLPTTFHQSETCWFLSVVYESNKREHAQLCIGCVVKITPRIKVPLSHSWLSGKNQRRIYFNFTKGRHDITGVFQFIWPSVSMQQARTPPTPPNHPSINTPRHKTPIHSLWKRNNSTTRCPKISDPRAHYFCVRSSWFPPWPKVFVGKTNEMMSQHCSSTWNTSRMAGPASDASSPFQMKPSASFFFSFLLIKCQMGSVHLKSTIKRCHVTSHSLQCVFILYATGGYIKTWRFAALVTDGAALQTSTRVNYNDMHAEPHTSLLTENSKWSVALYFSLQHLLMMLATSAKMGYILSRMDTSVNSSPEMK